MADDQGFVASSTILSLVQPVNAAASGWNMLLDGLSELQKAVPVRYKTTHI